ncbi:MAG: valine--tRNA ligase, partial [Candidatus Methanofastidiosia archaeon]
IKELEITKRKPQVEERITHIQPNYKVIGPKFGKDIQRIAELFDEKTVKELEKGEEIERDGFKLKREYIKSVKREYFKESEEVELVETEDFVMEIMR